MAIMLVIDETDPVWQDDQRARTLLKLWMAADEAGHLRLAVAGLATLLDRSPRTVQRLLRELEAGGWLSRHVTAGRMSGYYLTGAGIRRVGGPEPPVLSCQVPRGSPVHASRVSPVTNVSPLSDSALRSNERPVGADDEVPSEASSRTAPGRPRAPHSLPDASRLLRRHADRYQARFGQPFLVAWARDTQIYKRLVGAYGPEAVETLQDRYLAQSIDSFAGKRGYSVPQLASEAAGLVARAALRDCLTAEQTALADALMAAGLSEETALALVVDHPGDVIRAQLVAHRWRQGRGEPASAPRLARAIRERWVVPDEARPIVYPLYPGVDRAEEDLDAANPGDSSDRSPLAAALADWVEHAVIKI